MRATGLRAQEILDLQTDALSQLPHGQWSLRVPLGKLHNERVIPVDPETAALFGKILEIRNSPEVAEHLKPFLLVHHGRRYTRDAFRHCLAVVEKKVGLREHPTPHRLRHTYATELLRAGMHLVVLKELLGHRSLGMTLRYAALTGVEVHQAYAETISTAKLRHGLDSVRPKRAGTQSVSTRRHGLRERMDTVVTELETFRRDHVPRDRKKKAQRLIERLRRIAADVDMLLSSVE